MAIWSGIRHKLEKKRSEKDKVTETMKGYFGKFERDIPQKVIEN